MKNTEDIEISKKIAQKVLEAGGKAYYVGGFVRDRLLGDEKQKDIDIEVHGIPPEALKNILSSMGNIRSEGKSFGIYSLSGYNIDVAMPRTEKATGNGHRDFEIYVDPFIGTYKAAQRRDFTINAMMEDILTGEVIDHFGGREDLQKGILRCVSEETFGEDPLRVLRCAQFAARFGFETEEKTIEICKNIKTDTLPKERVMAELEKALLKSKKPSIFFETLGKMNALSTWFPELEALKGIPQPVKYHPEGDAYTHTLCVVDNAVQFRDKTSHPLWFMLSALCHDLGKAICTETESGKFHAINHETIGLPLCENLIKRLTDEKNLKKYVINMVKLHMKPNIMCSAKSSIKATNKMFDSAFYQEDLIYLCMADIFPTEYTENREDALESVENNKNFLFERLKIYREYMERPAVTGKDLIDAGIKPDEQFGAMLEEAHKLQLSGVKKEEILKKIIRGKK